MRAFLVCLVAAACTPPVERFAQEQPAFLGDASGIYLTHSAGQANLSEAIAVLIEVRDHLLLSFDVSGSAQPLFVNDTVQTDANGNSTVHEAFSAPLALLDPSLAVLFPAQASLALAEQTDVKLGLDAFTVSIHLTEDANFATLCGAVVASGLLPNCDVFKAAITQAGEKICDFDSRISGVFQTAVTHVSSDGDCSDAADLSGGREWALVAGDGAATAGLVSLDNDTLEFGLLLTFDPANQSFSLASPTTAGAAFNAGSSFSASVSIGSEQTNFTADFIRYSGDNCIERYSASGVRLTGTKAGIACPSATLCDRVEFSACPPVPAGVEGIYEIVGFTAVNGECPVPLCRLRLDPKAACDPFSPVLSDGCASGSAMFLASAAQPNDTFCYQPICVQSTACDALAPPDVLNAGACPSAGSFFDVVSNGPCTFAVCPGD